MKIIQFYDSENDFRKFYAILKQVMCPHCKLIGKLILWGYLRGNAEDHPNKRVIRGRRVFCNNRNNSNSGCGRTFSVLAAKMIKNFCITAESLWCFLKNNVTLTNKPDDTLIKNDFPLTVSSAYRLWKKFLDSQSKIRSFLTRLCQAPQLPETSRPETQTIKHLKSAFNLSPCPITAFQDHFQRSFI